MYGIKADQSYFLDDQRSFRSLYMCSRIRFVALESGLDFLRVFPLLLYPKRVRLVTSLNRNINVFVSLEIQDIKKVLHRFTRFRDQTCSHFKESKGQTFIPVIGDHRETYIKSLLSCKTRFT